MTNPALKQRVEEYASPPTHGATQGLVGLNTRIEGRLSDGLLRATMERRLGRMPKAKVQDIVGEALTEWLKKNGYLR